MFTDSEDNCDFLSCLSWFVGALCTACPHVYFMRWNGLVLEAEHLSFAVVASPRMLY